MKNRKLSPTNQRGYTILELLVVMVIIGIMSALAWSFFTQMQLRSKAASTAAELKNLGTGFLAYEAAHSEFPEDSHNVLPPGMDEFLSNELFEKEPPIGGNYNWEGPDSYPYAGISIINSPLGEEAYLQIDNKLDDGNLNTGKFRYGTSGRATFILAE